MTKLTSEDEKGFAFRNLEAWGENLKPQPKQNESK